MKFVPAILEQGLLPQARQFVHLSSTPERAREVASRHGSPVVPVVDAGGMDAAGLIFHCTAVGVWLTARVPPSTSATHTRSAQAIARTKTARKAPGDSQRRVRHSRANASDAAQTASPVTHEGDFGRWNSR
jgi:hypothetical protein